ncbi:hypothetical protein NEOC84_001893|nr:hypothetical protein [Neochlamydia sp. AcF84]
MCGVYSSFLIRERGMPGRFEGFTDTQWRILQPLLSQNPPKNLKGKPHTPWRKIYNSLFWILITGSRWCDLPKGPNWGSRSAAHRWLGKNGKKMEL